jgi:hypothetical protein
MIEFPNGQTKAPIPSGLRPRDCPVIELIYKEAPPSLFRLDISFWTAAKEPALTIPLHWDPTRGTAKSSFVSLDTLEGWVRLGIVTDISVKLREGTMPQLVSIRTDAKLPTITLVAPDNRARLPVDEKEPIFRFHAQPGLTHYRLYVHHAGAPLTWTLPREQLIQFENGGELGFKFSMAGALKSPPDPLQPSRVEHPGYWNDMTAGAFRTNVLDAKGVQGFDIDWWIEGFVAQPFIGPWRFHHAQARSPHFTLRVVQPDD